MTVALLEKTVLEGYSEVTDWKHSFTSKICSVRSTRTSQEATAINRITRCDRNWGTDRVYLHLTDAVGNWRLAEDVCAWGEDYIIDYFTLF
jgi:hypothetical protein